MTRRPAAAMPDSVRHFLRAKAHPARAVECPFCEARAHRPCTTISKRRQMPQPHPARVSAWVRATACCPVCQVEPGVDCHERGRPLHGGAVHARRQVEAEETAA